MGYSHTTEAKDRYINEHLKKPKVMADTLEVFMKAGVDTIMGQIQSPPLRDAIEEASAAHRPEDDHRVYPWLPCEA